MKSNFCTVIDKSFVFKGLALYNSILRFEDDFILWILSMDVETYDILVKLNLKNVKLIKLSEFENKALLKSKDNRNLIEYCWTCIPSFVLYLLKKHKDIKSIIYFDSDIYVFSSLIEIKNKLKKYSILLTPHRDGLSDEQARRQAGIYNAGFYAIKNDNIGLKAMETWSEQCIKECSDGMDGTYGSQRYLNDWPTIYKKVSVLDNKGMNAAMWNISRFKVLQTEEGIKVGRDKLVFYHFSRFLIINKNNFDYNIENLGFKVSNDIKKMIYTPYVKALKLAIKQVEDVDPGFRFGIKKESFLKKLIKKIRKD